MPAKPNPIDVHVGQRVRLRRMLLGMSQEKLGEQLGLTFQQIQKYERGTNRIGSSRLYMLSQILDVPVSFFFDDMPPSVLEDMPKPDDGSGGFDWSVINSAEAKQLLYLYHCIPDADVRRQVSQLMRSLGDSLAPAAETMAQNAD